MNQEQLDRFLDTYENFLDKSRALFEFAVFDCGITTYYARIKNDRISEEWASLGYIEEDQNRASQNIQESIQDALQNSVMLIEIIENALYNIQSIKDFSHELYIHRIDQLKRDTQNLIKDCFKYDKHFVREDISDLKKLRGLLLDLDKVIPDPLDLTRRESRYDIPLKKKTTSLNTLPSPKEIYRETEKAVSPFKSRLSYAKFKYFLQRFGKTDIKANLSVLYRYCLEESMIQKGQSEYISMALKEEGINMSKIQKAAYNEETKQNSLKKWNQEFMKEVKEEI